MNRKESRGPFYRTDYPYTDNDNWHARNILIPTPGGGVEFRVEPYATPYLEPEFGRRDYFDVPW